MKDVWDNELFTESALHGDLAALLGPQRWVDWPTAGALDALLRAAGAGAAGRPVRVEYARDAGAGGALAYEHGILARGAIPTRPRCWHDLFNALMWALYPATKAAINAAHVRDPAVPGSDRSRRRDALTLFDECGVVLPVADPRLTRLHAQRRWRDLFVDHRDAWGRRIAAQIVGHGLYDQCRRPYVGLTAKAWHLPVPAGWFEQPLAERYRQVDGRLAAAIEADDALLSPREMLPLPVLGVPGWWDANRDPLFYANDRYFRR